MRPPGHAPPLVQFALVLLLLVVVGCEQSAATPATRPTGARPIPATSTPLPPVLSLRVVRYSPYNPDPPFAAQTTNAVAVQRLFAATLAAPPYSHYGSWGCNADVSYLLTFSSATGVVLWAKRAGNVGCPMLELLNAPNGCRDDTPAYDQLLADTLDVPGADLSTVSVWSMPPGAPTAPAAPSATELPPNVSLAPCHTGV